MWPPPNCIPCPLLSGRLLVWGASHKRSLLGLLSAEDLNSVLPGRASSHPRQAPLLCSWDPLPMNRNPQCTKEQALENGCIFFYRLLFCWGLGFGRERKANFIFLTISLLFLVFHFYNYTLDFGTCVKLPLQIGQEVKTSKRRCFRWWQGWGSLKEGGVGAGESLGRLCNWITTELNNGFH